MDCAKAEENPLLVGYGNVLGRGVAVSTTEPPEKNPPCFPQSTSPTPFP